MGDISAYIQHGDLLKAFLCHIRRRGLDCAPIGPKLQVSVSFINYVKESLLKKAANIGLNTESVQVLDRKLQEKIKGSAFGVTVLEGAVLGTLLGQGRSCISFNQKGDITDRINGHTLISIDLRGIINNAFPELPVKVDELCLEPVKNDEREVLSVLRDKRYHAVKLIKKGVAIDRVECEEKLPVSKRVVDILNEAAFQDIEIKQESGKPVYLNRKVKRKL